MSFYPSFGLPALLQSPGPSPGPFINRRNSRLLGRRPLASPAPGGALGGDKRHCALGGYGLGGVAPWGPRAATAAVGALLVRGSSKLCAGLGGPPSHCLPPLLFFPSDRRPGKPGARSPGVFQVLAGRGGGASVGGSARRCGASRGPRGSVHPRATHLQRARWEAGARGDTPKERERAPPHRPGPTLQARALEARGGWRPGL